MRAVLALVILAFWAAVVSSATVGLLHVVTALLFIMMLAVAGLIAWGQAERSKWDDR